MNVIEATHETERRAAYALRYRVYEQLGWTYPGMDHENGLIVDEQDEVAALFCILNEGETVATIRLYAAPYAPKEYAEKIALANFSPFGLERVGLADRLVIREDYRNSAAAGILFSQFFKIALERGFRIGLLDCAPHLVRMYEHLGFRQYTHGFYYGGYNVPLALIMDDTDYMREISSPLWRAVRDRESSRRTSVWFEQTFPDFAFSRPTDKLSENDLWAYLVHGEHRSWTELSFLAGFSEDEALILSRELAVINGAAGDTILTEQEHSECMFCVQAGTLDVIVDERAIDTLHPGDTFGEIGFVANMPRSAAIRARTDCRLLVLMRKDFERLEKQQPQLALRLLNNLFKILAHRFHELSLRRNGTGGRLCTGRS